MAMPMPTALVHMEAAYTAHKLQMEPEVSHRYREGNQWADALANGDTAGFSEANRYAPKDFDMSYFYVLGPLVEAWLKAQ